jgi:hypothetical protein
VLDGALDIPLSSSCVRELIDSKVSGCSTHVYFAIFKLDRVPRRSSKLASSPSASLRACKAPPSELQFWFQFRQGNIPFEQV